MNKLHILIAAFCIISSVGALGQDATAYPFYVKVLQTYNYPGTGLVSSPNEVEQVIAETPPAFLVTTPDGTAIQLPKTMAKRISDREAADLLFAERKQHHDRYAELMAQAMQLANTVNELRSEPAPTAAELRELIKLNEDVQNMNKSPNNKRVPSRNRYEIEIR